MDASSIAALLRTRNIVLTGLMGAGKSAIGRRLAARLGCAFVDADREIEAAAGCSIAEIFERHGETAFRDGEKRVIERLLAEPGQVVATGGGAYMNPETRATIAAQGLAVWLRADLDTLVERTSRRQNRPLLKDGDPRETLARLIEERHPVYAAADITVQSGDLTPEDMVDRVIEALERHLGAAP